MKITSVRLRLVIAMLAWLAQAFMPLAHATAMAGAGAAGTIWCGEPASAVAALSLLPAELRAALDDGGTTAEDLASCALACAIGTGTPPPAALAPTVALRAAGLEPARAPLTRPTARPQAPTPPAHAPPALG